MFVAPVSPFRTCSPCHRAARPASEGLEVVVKEFMSLSKLKRAPQLTSMDAQQRECIIRNRYSDVVPFDANRVRISNGGYINASIISQGIIRANAYIAAQAPLPNTFVDFWLMIWVPVIVMLTRFMERRKIKAHCYWPTEIGEKETFGTIEVELLSVSSEEHLSLKVFKMSNIVNGETRTVDHIHYTEWPDFGVPQSTATLRTLVNMLDHYQAAVQDAPLLIHCSAGIGRAGTLISIHSFLSRYYEGESGLSIPKIVEELRNQRIGMVQTEEQYLMIYQTVEDILSSQRRHLSLSAPQFDTPHSSIRSASGNLLSSNRDSVELSVGCV